MREFILTEHELQLMLDKLTVICGSIENPPEELLHLIGDITQIIGSKK